MAVTLKGQLVWQPERSSEWLLRTPVWFRNREKGMKDIKEAGKEILMRSIKKL
jgi:hypothetical protein